MKKQPKVGTLTVIRPRKRARQTPPKPQGGAEMVHEAIDAIRGVMEAGRRAHAVYKKIRGK